MEESPSGSAPEQGDDQIPAWIAEVQTAFENGDSPSAARMRIVQAGADGEVADAIVDKVYNAGEGIQPLSRRRRRSAATAAAGESQSWLWWIGILVGINVLSWAFDWPFWIY